MFDVTAIKKSFGPNGKFQTYPFKDISYALTKYSNLEEDAAVVGEFRGGGLLWGGLLVFGGFAMYVLSRFEDSKSYVEGCDRLTAGGSLCCHLCWCCGEGLFLLAQESCSRSDSSSGCNERSSSRCDSQGGGERRGHYGQVLMKNCM